MVAWGRVGIAVALLALAGCTAGSGCDLVQVAQVPLELKGRLPTVPVTVNGHKLSFLLDTGSTKSLLNEATVRRLKIVRDARFYTPLIGVAGGSSQDDASVDSLAIGDAPIDQSRMSVSTMGNLPIDGILGLDIIRDFDLDIDVPKRALTLYRVRRCQQADPPWQEPAVRIPDASTMSGWLRVPFAVDDIEGSAAFDTGASQTMILPQMMRRLGLTEQALASDRSIRTTVIASGTSDVRLHRFRSLRVGPVTVPDAFILVITKEPPAFGYAGSFGDGAIGMEFVLTRRVWFSFRTARLYVAAPR